MRLSTWMLQSSVCFSLLMPTAVFAFPPTTWLDPADTTASVKAWNNLPAFSGTIAKTWPKIPLKANAKVLFIGNSLLGAGGSENETFDRLMKKFHPALNVKVKEMGRGQAWLRDYIKETELGILDSIRSGHWDVLVCQPYQDSYWPKMPESSPTDLAGLRVFVDACDSLYKECAKVGMQMVLWSVHGYQSDDRFHYLAYSALNCRRVSKRLNIPYAFTCETFDTIYRKTDDPFLWADIIHQSTEATAVYSTLIYSLLMGGQKIDAWPANWSTISGMNWGSSLRHQDVLTSATKNTITAQNVWNFTPTGIAAQPGLHATGLRKVENVSTTRTVLANGRMRTVPTGAASFTVRGKTGVVIRSSAVKK